MVLAADPMRLTSFAPACAPFNLEAREYFFSDVLKIENPLKPASTLVKQLYNAP
jgi:hypothetical protein